MTGALPEQSAREPAVKLGESLDPLVLLIDQAAGFDALRSELQAVVGAAEEGSLGSQAQLDIGEGELDLFELRQLVRLLEEEHQIKAVALRCGDGALRRFAARELKLEIIVHAALEAPAEAEDPPPAEQSPQPYLAANPADTPDVDPRRFEDGDDDLDLGDALLTEDSIEDSIDLPPPERAVSASDTSLRVIRRTLRSGTVVRHAGDVILFGDVNPGAEVLAGGDITVLGALKGLAHAGTRGDESAFILGIEFNPTQLRIGPHISIPSHRSSRDRRPTKAQIAFLRDGEIVTEPYRGRLPRHDTKRSDA